MIASIRTSNEASDSPVAAALGECRSAFWSVALFSGAVNVLMLGGPLYMLQVYDRVLSSRSVPTLVALSLLLAGVYLFQGILDAIRSRLVVRVASLLDHQLESRVHGAVLQLALTMPANNVRVNPVRDLDQIRSFMTGNGPIAIVDLPWMPAFLLICYLIHPWLGSLALVGALVLIGVALLTERAARAPLGVLTRENARQLALIEGDRRNSETAAALGMVPDLTRRWAAINRRYLSAHERTSDVVSGYGSLSKMLRLFLQSAMLGVGAYFVIHGELIAGAMIAASIMMARAVAPVETAIANWRSFITARASFQRLSASLAALDRANEHTPLPAPAERIDVENLHVAAPGGAKPIVARISFTLSGGEALCVLGPSGSGKTSLARALVGAWPAMAGSIRLDGASLDQWAPEAIGPHLGYMAQTIELFEGTVAENIARMQMDADPDAVIEAARIAGAHDMIVHLPQGYDTPIGEGGAALSGGQRQRIALARAVYGKPFLVVLDEPNSNLDNVGESALQLAVAALKARGAIVIIVSHRHSAVSVCDKVLALNGGMQKAFGPRDEVLSAISKIRVAGSGRSGNLQVLSAASKVPA